MNSPFNKLSKLAKEVNQIKKEKQEYIELKTKIQTEEYPIAEKIYNSNMELRLQRLESQINKITINLELFKQRIVNQFRQDQVDLLFGITKDFDEKRREDFNQLFEKTPIKLFSYSLVRKKNEKNN